MNAAEVGNLRELLEQAGLERLLDTLVEHEMDAIALSLADASDWEEMGVCDADVQRLKPYAAAAGLRQRLQAPPAAQKVRARHAAAQPEPPTTPTHLEAVAPHTPVPTATQHTASPPGHISMGARHSGVGAGAAELGGGFGLLGLPDQLLAAGLLSRGRYSHSDAA
jgi:hypothetical protein